MADIVLSRFESAFISALEREAQKAIQEGIKEIVLARGYDPDNDLWYVGKNDKGEFVLRVPDPPLLTNGHIEKIIPEPIQVPINESAA